jgi:hypothetical protein
VGEQFGRRIFGRVTKRGQLAHASGVDAVGAQRRSGSIAAGVVGGNRNPGRGQGGFDGEYREQGVRRTDYAVAQSDGLPSGLGLHQMK